MDVRADTYMADIGGRSKPKAGLVASVAIFAAPFLIVAAAVGLLMVMMATAKKPEKSDEPPLPIAVEIATARAIDTTLRVTTQGQVKSKNEAALAAQVAGQLIEISPLLEPGASFKKGDVLARIDPAQYKLAVDRSRSQVARAREALARARSEADLAERDWKDLGLTGDPSDLTLQKPQVNAATADLKTAEAAVNESQLNLDRTEIRAPFDGRVMTRRANVGDYIAPGAPIATIFAVDVAQVRIPLTDADLAVLDIAPGFVANEAEAPAAKLSAVVAGERREWNGELSLVDASVDATTRLVYGLVEVADPFGEGYAAPLAPGLFVDVAVESGASQSLIAIPRSALKKNQYVYAVADDFTIRAREVTPMMADATTLYFSDGVAAGERFVASFLPSPRDGMKVRDIKAPTPKKEETPADAKKKVADADKKQKK
jgi:RND family efflux transporter MFP subunit